MNRTAKSGGEPRHPRALLAFRTLLYATVLVLLGALVAGVVGYLGVVLVVGGVAAVLGGGVDPAVLLGAAGVGVLGVGLLGTGVVAAARRADRRVTALDARPDPVEAVKRRYVEADLTEAEFERELERALDPDAPGDAGDDDRDGPPGDDDRGRDGRRDRQRERAADRPSAD